MVSRECPRKPRPPLLSRQYQRTGAPFSSSHAPGLGDAHASRDAYTYLVMREQTASSVVAERLAQVIEQVVAVLDADRQPDQVAGHLEGRAGDGGVRHPCRVLDQRLDPAERLA